MRPQRRPKAEGASAGTPERVQKVLAQLGLASRREAEAWIRAGRLQVNGAPAVLGMRVGPHDELKLDGRAVRQQVARAVPVFLCHRSPGEPLLPSREVREGPEPALSSIAARLPRRAGRRFVAISPLPRVDGGLELLTADGAMAARLQRAIRGLEIEFSLRVRGELGPEQQAAIREGRLDRGSAVEVMLLEAQQPLVPARRARRQRQRRASARRARRGHPGAHAAYAARYLEPAAYAGTQPLARADGYGAGRGAWQSRLRPVMPRLAGPSSHR